jgi:nicotinate-nucleotide adenylyltransferase
MTPQYECVPSVNVDVGGKRKSSIRKPSCPVGTRGGCQPRRATSHVHFLVVSNAVPRRIGLFGGTFDPPHVGHLVTAVNVRHTLNLDLVLLMVAHVPWQKIDSRRISPSDDRLAMVDAAVSNVTGLEASDLEIRRGGSSYTADTLAELEDRYPGAQLFTIVGDDAAAGIDTWERFGEIAERSRLVVVDRPGAQVELPQVTEWIRVEVPHLEVSSTDLRARVREGRPLDYLVPEPVLEMISKLGLYEVDAWD